MQTAHPPETLDQIQTKQDLPPSKQQFVASRTLHILYIYIYYIYIGSLQVDFRVEQCSIR